MAQSVNQPLRWLLISQNLVLFGSSFVFPYYVIFIKEVGASFTQFGVAYALFAISGAAVHGWIGRLSDRYDRSLLLAISSWGTACLFVLYPGVTALFQVYLLQVGMGLFGALQKTVEKVLVADLTEVSGRGGRIGRYHAWTTLFSGVAVMAAGYAIDLFTLDLIFYIGSAFMFISGVVALNIKAKPV